MLYFAARSIVRLLSEKNDLLYDDVRLVVKVCLLEFLSLLLVSCTRVLGIIEVI